MPRNIFNTASSVPSLTHRHKANEAASDETTPRTSAGGGASPSTENVGVSGNANDGFDHVHGVHANHNEAFVSRAPQDDAGVPVVGAQRSEATERKSNNVSANVQALQELYGISEPLGRPRERILHWLARIQDGLVSTAEGDVTPKDIAQTADQYLQSNLRLDVFYLEGILKLYKKRHPEISPMFDDIKAFEDALGAASGARSALKSARELPDLPAPALAWLEAQVQQADTALHAELQKNWQVDDQGHVPIFSRLVQELSDGSWDKYGSDKKNLVAELDRRLKKFQKAEMDMGVLQGDTGVHELRRQLRWIPIYAVALDGLFRFDDARHPISSYASLMDTDLVHSKYAQLPPSHREKAPIPFSHSLYLRITELIDELGRIKDEGESIEAIAHALIGSGCATDLHDATAQAEQILGVPPGSEEAVFAQAQKIYDEMQANHFIRAVRDEVRERELDS